jgi:hypothetical protein
MNAQASTPPISEFELGGLRFRYEIGWSGQPLRGRHIAVDTETALADGPEIPKLALISVSDGRRHVLLHPKDLAEFILAHHDRNLIFQNCAFDYWVVHKLLQDRNDVSALATWRRFLEGRRIHDTMLLDMLLRLAGDGESAVAGEGGEIVPRSLEMIARDCLGVVIDKSNPYRTRFGELIGKDWEEVDPGFWTYAIADSIVTYLAYHELADRARQVMATNGYDPGLTERFAIMPDAVERFGLLSEAIQVEGAIALEQISRSGMHLDVTRVMAIEKERKDQMREMVARFQLEYPGHFKTDRQGRLKATKKTGAPQRANKFVTEALSQAAQEMVAKGVPIEIPYNPSGEISLSTKKWLGYADFHPFVKLWCDYEAQSKLTQFFAGLKQSVIHPRYDVLKRTGRTSCSRPNIQQIPRSDEFRELFVASPGHYLLAVDYRYVELVALAAVCEARFGRSRLADVIRQGIDPHAFTAAMVLGVPFDEFMSWEGSEQVVEIDGKRQTLGRRFKDARQFAKPVNFGVPGGLGAASLVTYARAKYGVEMTLEQAESFHQKLTRDIYPELAIYLGDWSMSRLASRLGIHKSICWDAFSYNGEQSPATPRSIRKVVEGKAYKADGTPYRSDYVRHIWQTLASLCHDPDLRTRLGSREGSPSLARELFRDTAVTLTGRIRAGVSYTEERNTGFQGLTSDGSKRALSRLVLAGYRVVGFIHDEFLIEIPDLGGYSSAEEVEKAVEIIRTSMEEVTQGIPVSCEYTLSTCWTKRAKLIVKDGRIIPWRPETNHK